MADPLTNAIGLLPWLMDYAHMQVVVWDEVDRNIERWENEGGPVVEQRPYYKLPLVLA